MPDFINSSAMILKPKQAFLEWLRSENIHQTLPADTREMLSTLNLDVMRANGTVVAMPLIKTDLHHESQQFVATHAPEILDTELLRWGLTSAALPATPPLQLLQDWFDLSYHSHMIVFDAEAAQWKQLTTD